MNPYAGPQSYRYSQGDDFGRGDAFPSSGGADEPVNYLAEVDDLDDRGDVEGSWEPPQAEEFLECCPFCLLAGTALTRVQDAHGREVVTCVRCGQRVQPALVPAPDRSTGQLAGDNYFQATSIPEPPRRQRPRGLGPSDVLGAIRQPKPAPKAGPLYLDPREGATRPS